MKIRDAKDKESFIQHMIDAYKRHRDAVEAYDEDTDIGMPVMDNVVLYELDRQYGGAEEGGWWYDAGTVEITVRFHGEHELRIWLAAMWEITRTQVMENRPYTSVAGGLDYEVRLSDGPGRDYPAERPHYE